MAHLDEEDGGDEEPAYVADDGAAPEFAPAEEVEEEEHEEEVYDDPDYIPGMEEEEIPRSPPARVAKLGHWFVEQFLDEAMVEDPSLSVVDAKLMLRKRWKEELGKAEKQRLKKQHKALRRRFDQQLALYQSAHPNFDADAYYAAEKASKSGSRSRKRRASGDGGGGRRRQEFTMVEFDHGDEYGAGVDEEAAPARKRRRRESEGGPESVVDTLMKQARAGRPRRRRRLRDGERFEPQPEVLQNMEAFVRDMRVAAATDRESNERHETCIAMLKLLPRVVAELSKTLLHRTFVEDCQVLDAVRDWLMPLPDGSLPPAAVRHELYRILVNMRLHALDDLRRVFEVSDEVGREQEPPRAGFAKTMMALFAHPQETAANKALLRPAIDQWIRAITGTAVKYEEAEEFAREEQREIMARSRLLAEQIAATRLDTGVARQRARVPTKPWNDYAIRPPNKVRDEMDLGGSQDRAQRKHERQAQINDRFKLLNKRAPGQAAHPSLSGRRG